MIALATTFTQRGYELHGKNFLDGFRRHWPKSATLYLYPEGFSLPSEDNIVVRELHAACPELVSFKARHQGNPGAHGRYGNRYVFQMDAIKWAHRIFALKAAMDAFAGDVLINIDADIVTFRDVPEAFLADFVADAHIAYMPRKQMYSECSFVAYRVFDRLVRRFIAAHQRFYETDDIFTLPGWTDCHAFDRLVQMTQRDLRFKDINAGLPSSMHPFVNGPLGAFMDHLKGPRKHEGRSRHEDLVVDRGEAYWAVPSLR